MDGVLIVDKPPELTSHDAVAHLRRLTGERKIGHTGTLDPLATGVLVLGLGAGTKILPFLDEGSKIYRAEAQLGNATDTQDRTGRTISECRDFALAYDELICGLTSFVGRILQTPPMYSAVQIGGVRLYHLARAGLEVERPAREIEIRELRLESPGASEKPFLRYGDRFIFTVTGSRGLYVRTLCHDLGTRLGCGAHLTDLRRLSSGPFKIENAVPLLRLTEMEVESRILPIGKALSHIPAIILDETLLERVRHGNLITAGNLSGGEIAQAMDQSGRTIAILRRDRLGWQPVRVL